VRKEEQILILDRNRQLFERIFDSISEEEVHWKPDEHQWSILEIVCHLHDEECEDFRMRLRMVLENPEKTPPGIDPQGWVRERDYMSRSYQEMVDSFLLERKNSVSWLNSLQDALWTNTYQHPKLGPLSGSKYLANWIAHDYLHFRQIMKTRYMFLSEKTGEKLDYAGGL
jgi:hypothetical protein